MAPYNFETITHLAWQFDEIVHNFLKIFRPYILGQFKPYWPKFSRVFQLLFKPFERNSNIHSWLQIFQNLDPSRLLHGTQLNGEQMRYLREELSKLPTWDMVTFFIYLIEIYSNMMASYDPKRGSDNIFGFMTRFPVHKTKVVILGKEPSQFVPSKGFAFHGSVCPSTANLLSNLNKDLRVADSFSCNPERLALDTIELAVTQLSCILDGWIDQDVLLLNCMLTFQEPLWLNMTKCIIEYLCENLTGLVFIATGHQSLMFAHRWETYENKHMWIQVYHPARECYNRYSKKDLSWEYNLPFLNANLYLYQTGKKMIDWTSISKFEKEQAQSREALYINSFDSILRYNEQTNDNIDMLDMGTMSSAYRPHITVQNKFIVNACIYSIRNESWRRYLPNWS